MPMNGPTQFLAALGLLGLSIVFVLAGLSSSYWMTGTYSRSSIHYGLWSICSGTTCISIGSAGGHVYFGRFAAIFQLIMALAAGATLLFFSFQEARQKWAKSAYSSALSAGIVGFLGAVVFIGVEKAADNAYDVGWSGILVIVASILQWTAGVCIYLPIHKGQVQFAEPAVQ